MDTMRVNVNIAKHLLLFEVFFFCCCFIEWIYDLSFADKKTRNKLKRTSHETYTKRYISVNSGNVCICFGCEFVLIIRYAINIRRIIARQYFFSQNHFKIMQKIACRSSWAITLQKKGIYIQNGKQISSHSPLNELRSWGWGSPLK